jgi:hypothetical protein
VLIDLTSSSRRLALVGLAKNTGKTETLAALLRELEAAERTVGVTSVGRDGEERDVIDARIAKPRVRLRAGSLVASTDELLRASGLAHEVLELTDARTPLGRVQLARMGEAGAVEVAGPSAAAQVRAVSDAMLALGAEQVLIDGAIDRRAASSPEVSDGLVMATGAVLSADLEEVVARTRDAVELVRLPGLDQGSPASARARELLSGAPTAGSEHGALLGAGGEVHPLPPRFVLRAESAEVAALLLAHPEATQLVIGGALPERFLEQLRVGLSRAERGLVVVVRDSTRVFLQARSSSWYRQQGIDLRAYERIDLRALTVNPVAPQSHKFDSEQLRSALGEALDDVPIIDVCDADYVGAQDA